ncbi:MAG: hypothetical protein ABSF99_02775 [Anaerolineales bacterium]|jgi:hypothetical protein
MKRFSAQHLILAVIILLSILGGIIDIYTTANGPWGYNDPVEYIATARSLDAGQGLGYVQGDGRFSPIRIHPPFYSLLLAAIGLFKGDLIIASRWLNISAFVACIFMAGWIFYRYSRAPALGIITSALLLTFPNMIWMFSSAYSEPLFILLILSGGLCLVAYMHKKCISLLITSAVLIGLIAVTRYAGIAMIVAGAVSVFLFTLGEPRIRIRKALLFGLMASLPVLVWLIWIYFSSAHSLGGRNIGLDWKGLAAQFKTFMSLFIPTVGSWVPQSNKLALTYRLRLPLVGAGLAGILAFSTWSIMRLRKRSVPEGNRSDLPIFTFFGLSAFSFVAVLLLTYLFTRPTIDIDNRMLLPFFVCCVMALFGAFALWQAAWSKGWSFVFQIVTWLVAVFCLFWYIPQTQVEVTFYHKGDGLTAYYWGHSKIIQAVSAFPNNQPVISNDWQLLLLWTGRPIYGMWVSFPATLPIQKTPYGTLQSDRAQVVFCSQGAALVVFNDFSSQFRSNVGDIPDNQRQNLFKGLKVYGKYPEGKIYLCP